MQKNRHANAQHNLAPITAEWFPIYLEPIRHSGERITIGVAVVADDVTLNRVVSTLPVDITKCLYRNRYNQLTDIADIALADIRHFLHNSSDISKIICSLDGVEIGPVRGIVEYSIEAMLATAARLTSSLAAVETTIEAAEEKIIPWQKTVESIILQKRPGLQKNFNRPLMIRNRQIATVGYVGNHFAANFYEIKSGRSNLTNAADQSIRRLVQMKSYIVKSSDNQMGIDWSGLILHKPQTTLKESGALENQLETLNEYADSMGLVIKLVETAEAAAEIILADAN